ncbi:hypothetical protein AKJ09_02549 [Labilithrix luteola]|uniref:Uncharacterized protein n=1 Tax=Labilithrix luteola TaxID=1391654 RepID=A0A0K1PQR4_9BACT|nr:hypothetical protein [Labilithrix luteola]AKU95885.1 hypothetical protein AKJ09_02549 [Labilithrix luteola]
MADFDLKGADVRILECAKCDEPVSATPASDGRRIRLTCAKCSFEQERELSTSPSPSKTGRHGKGRPDIALTRTNLSEPLEDVPLRATLAEIRKLFVEQKKKLVGGVPNAERADAEFRLLWLCANLAVQQIKGRDFVHARALLEATLEALTIPAYRALALARLARLAAMSNAQELGERWLAVCPKDLPNAEVNGDVRLAEALLANARGDSKSVLSLVGEGEADAGAFTGGSRWLAVSLRVDAHEKLGDRGQALRLWRKAARGNAVILANTAQAWGLAKETRKRLSKSSAIWLPAFAVFLLAGLALVRTVLSGEVASTGLVITIVLAGVVLLVGRLL